MEPTITPDELEPDETEPTTAPVETPEPDEEEAEEQADREREQEAHPTEPQGVSDREWEERFKKADKAFDTYVKRVTALWEDDALHLQPFALSTMAPPGFIDVREAGRVPEEIKGAALAYLGFAREQDYEPDPETRECPTCKGKGKTKTGSHVAGRETRPCPSCLGTGATGLNSAIVATDTNGHAVTAFTLAGSDATTGVEKDAWGEPRILPDGRENPNYGKMPQFKVPVEPWGVTANLTAQDVAV